MWVDYRVSLSTVYNDGDILICGQIVGGHLVLLVVNKELQKHNTTDTLLATKYP